MAQLRPPAAHTFSIVGYDPENKEWGIAVQSKFLAVGAVVPWAKAGVGAVATQSFANTRYGPEGLALLESGLSAQAAVDRLVAADPDRAIRQVGIVDAQGRAASFTGEMCIGWAGSFIGKHYTVLGNMLVGEETLQAMAESFEQTQGPLPWRLLSALEAGQAAGGDVRGQQAAALLVVREKGGYGGWNDRAVDLRVDDHSQPIEELKRLYHLHRVFYGEKQEVGQDGSRGDRQGFGPSL